jgi:hypothetical protein
MPKDIANIRLVSRSFHQLPGYLFKHLIKGHMPWFREVDELEHRDECFGRRFQCRIFADVQPTSIGCEYISNARTPEENVGRQKSSKIHKLVEESVDRIRRLQTEGPSGKYHILGNRLEWLGRTGSLSPLEAPVHVTHSWHCPRCVQKKISSCKN